MWPNRAIRLNWNRNEDKKLGEKLIFKLLEWFLVCRLQEERQRRQSAIERTSAV